MRGSYLGSVPLSGCPSHLKSQGSSNHIKMIALIVSLLIAGAWADCVSDIQNCVNSFQTQIQSADGNIVTSCQDSENFVNCLHQLESDTACARMKSQIQTQILTATQKIVATGCNPKGGADTCLTDIQQCENVLHTEIAKVDHSNTAAQCKVAYDFMACLKAIQCSGANEGKVDEAIQKVSTDERTSHCV